jgi:hypothetical protein
MKAERRGALWLSNKQAAITTLKPMEFLGLGF